MSDDESIVNVTVDYVPSGTADLAVVTLTTRGTPDDVRADALALVPDGTSVIGVDVQVENEAGVMEVVE